MVNIFIKFTVLMSIVGIIIFPSEVIMSGKNAIELAFFNVIPSLFPFFVLQTLFVEMGISDFVSKYIGGVFKKVFKISDASPYILGIIGGYPVGFKAVVNLYEQNKIDKKEAERMVGFCNNAGPAFVIGFVGIFLFQNKFIGYILLLGHILSSFLVGIIFSKKSDYKLRQVSKKVQKKPFYELFINAVNTGFASILTVCGYIVFFSIFAEILICFNVFNSISYIIQPIFRLIGFSTDDLTSVMIGMIEMSTGINYLSTVNSATEIKIILSSFMLGFAGLSIHFQSLNFNKGLNLSYYFKGKLLQSIFSPIISLFLYKSLYNYINTSTGSSLYSNEVFYVANIVVISMFIILMLCKKLRR